MRSANCSPEDLCHIQYTAGTTGTPKGAMLTHGNWMTALDTERDALRSPAGRCLPRYLSDGPCRALVGARRHPCRGHVCDDGTVRSRRYLELADQYRSRCLPACPRSSIPWSIPRPARRARLASARVIISGGGQLLPVVWEAFDHRYHIPVANSYGLSETIVIGSGTTTLPEYPHLTKNYQSVGVAVGYTEIRIVDTGDPERELPYGECGEIALRGPAVAKGYWNMPEATREVFQADGWFLTGDIGYLDEEGILCITDRKKDMIIMSGWKIYPTEVENVMIRHPAIADVAVFGVPDERKGRGPGCGNRVPARDALHEKELEILPGYLAGYKIPRKLMVVGSLPRVHGWKLLRRDLREKFGGSGS
jgi:long-chain acyl-CoA synthetase